ncbi:MAG: rhodanese-like domain-containing protein [Nitrospirae bacterium]|nr:rhodanese-like domain-containing protein [Nitrospirota bacterium]
MRNSLKILMTVLSLLALLSPAYALSPAAVKELDAVLSQGPANKHFQVNANQLYGWIKAKKNNFQVVDVRLKAKDFKGGHVPGAIHIPYNEILKPENLKKLPKDKILVLYCYTGQTQNLPVVALRALGYDARVLAFGYTSWAKGYWGGNMMKRAIGNAAKNNFPVER